jgi:acyl-coenzyme A thioesterase PaaI-like protein
MSATTDHENCLFCGRQNPFSLKLEFQAAAEKGVRARFRPHGNLQGYAGRMHGGAIAGVLDAAMTHCLFREGIRAVTADLHVRYLLPAACRSELEVRSWILSSAPPLHRLRAELAHNGSIVAWAEAKFLEEEYAQHR